MGRPPRNLIRSNFYVSQKTLDRIDKLVGPNQRSEWIRQTLEKALDIAEFPNSLARQRTIEEE